MYQIVKKRAILLYPNKYLKPGLYIITKHSKPILEVKIRAIDKFPD